MSHFHVSFPITPSTSLEFSQPHHLIMDLHAFVHVLPFDWNLLPMWKTHIGFKAITSHPFNEDHSNICVQTSWLCAVSTDTLLSRFAYFLFSVSHAWLFQIQHLSHQHTTIFFYTDIFFINLLEANYLIFKSLLHGWAYQCTFIILALRGPK